MSEMFSRINNACADTTTGNTFSTFVSADSVVAELDFGRMLQGGAPVSREVHLNIEKPMYRRVIDIPWTENTVCFLPGSAAVGVGLNQLEDNHGFWSTYYAGAVQLQPQESKEPPAPTPTSIAKLDSIPATPPLLSDIVTLISSSGVTTDCDKVASAGQSPNDFATFIDILPMLPYAAASSTGIQSSQFPFGTANSTSTCSAPATEMEAAAAVRPPNCKRESGKSDAQPRRLPGSVHSGSCLEAKDDQVKKILSKCGRWTQSATANKSLQWTSVGIDKPKPHGRLTKGSSYLTMRSTPGPAGRQHGGSSRTVPSEKAEHIQRERERRIQLRAMYKTLDTLVPAQSRTAKRDRTTIVNDALNYVKEMREKLEKLQAYKSKPIMSTIALSELIAQNIEKRNNHGLAGTIMDRTLSPTRTSQIDIDVEHGEADKRVVETADLLMKPDIHVFMGSSGQVFININCGPMPNLLSRILKAMDLLQLDVSHYTFSRLCSQFVNCHFAAKIRRLARLGVDTSCLTESIQEVLSESLG